MPAIVRRLTRVRAILALLLVLTLVAAVPILDPHVSEAAPATLALETGGPSARSGRESPVNTAPTVSIAPSAGQYVAGQQVTITITYCDSQNLNTTTAIRRFNDVDMAWPVTYSIGNPGPCLARAVVSGTVTLLAGQNTVRASIEDADPIPLWSGWMLATYTTSVPWSGVIVMPDNQFVDATTGQVTTQQFIVQNLGDVTTTFALSDSSAFQRAISL